MKQSIHILYLSGFGNTYDTLRLRYLKLWHFAGVSVELVPLRWEGKESFEQKLARIDQAIDRVKGKRIVLLGESAGGSMAMHMYARRPDDLHKVMTICGKNAYPETVSESYYRRSAAFRTSMERLNEAAGLLTKKQRQAFVSLYPFYDSTVPVRETIIDDCKRVRLWSVGHLATIFLALTVYSPIVVRQAKK